MTRVMGARMSKAQQASAAAALALILVSATAAAQTVVAAPPHTTNVNGFIVTEGDIADRPYDVVGHVSVKVGKLTWVSGNPDRLKADAKLMTKARQMGADAVVRVTYTPTGVSAMSWGGIKAEGTAIRYRPHVAPVTSPPAEGGADR